MPATAITTSGAPAATGGRTSPTGLLLALLLVAGCVGGEEGSDEEAAADPWLDPSSAEMSRRAPDRYRVRFVTTAGEFVVEVRRDLAPRGADRFYNLVRGGFYDGSRFFRVVEGFVAQFGLAADPRVSRAWRSAPLRDDSVRTSNERGTLAFAHAGPGTRTTQVFVNLVDNARLDTMGFAPFGRVVRGMEVVDRLEDRYGEAPAQAEIMRRGEAYLAEEFPELDVIEAAEIPGGERSTGEETSREQGREKAGAESRGSESAAAESEGAVSGGGVADR